MKVAVTAMRLMIAGTGLHSDDRAAGSLPDTYAVVRVGELRVEHARELFVALSRLPANRVVGTVDESYVDFFDNAVAPIAIVRDLVSNCRVAVFAFQLFLTAMRFSAQTVPLLTHDEAQREERHERLAGHGDSAERDTRASAQKRWMLRTQDAVCTGAVERYRAANCLMSLDLDEREQLRRDLFAVLALQHTGHLLLSQNDIATRMIDKGVVTDVARWHTTIAGGAAAASSAAPPLPSAPASTSAPSWWCSIKCASPLYAPPDRDGNVYVPAVRDGRPAAGRYVATRAQIVKKTGCPNPLSASDCAAQYEAMQLHVDNAVVKAIMNFATLNGIASVPVGFLLARLFPAPADVVSSFLESQLRTLAQREVRVIPAASLRLHALTEPLPCHRHGVRGAAPRPASWHVRREGPSMRSSLLARLNPASERFCTAGTTENI